MTVTVAEADAMRRAIALSALGLGSTSPNPPVGCVILDKDGRPVGEGFHRRKGLAHAEVNALKAAGVRAVGGTAVVTLEPCNHHGRTPPCHQALLDAGIARVLVAVIDPTSRGRGGVARLRDAGVEVEVGVLDEEALLILGPWLGALRSGKPRVLWAFEAHPSGPRALPDHDLALVAPPVAVDAVLRTDGYDEEGRAGAHGVNVFTLPDSVDTDDPERALADLLARGVRSLLLHGGADLGETFLHRQLVDELIVAVHPADDDASARPASSPTTFLPIGFRVRAVQRLESGAVLHAVPIIDRPEIE